MAWSLVQNALASNLTTASPTIAVTNPIGSGNIYCGAIAHDSTQTLNSITDDKGNTYNVIITTADATNAIHLVQFSLGNITNGPKTITFNFSAVTNACAVVGEFSGGLAASNPTDGSVGQFQASVASGANNQTSTAITTTADGDLIVGAGSDDGSNTPSSIGTSPNVFTAFNAGADNTTLILSIRMEFFAQTTHGSIAATFGIPANGDPACTNVVAFKPAAGGGFTPKFRKTLSQIGGRVGSRQPQGWG